MVEVIFFGYVAIFNDKNDFSSLFFPYDLNHCHSFLYRKWREAQFCLSQVDFFIKIVSILN